MEKGFLDIVKTVYFTPENAHFYRTEGGFAALKAYLPADSGNDLRMLEAAGFPVAMGNAEDRVKAAARVVTAPYLEDGVALAVERYVLGEAGGV